MITYKNETIPLSKIAKEITMLFVVTGEYEMDSPEYRANLDYIQESPEYAIKWMFNNTKPSDFGLSFDKWESLEEIKFNKGDN